MYHPFKKNSSFVRVALYREYGGKCQYCSMPIQFRYMHVDHILPSNNQQINDEELQSYINELKEQGFIKDSLENYFPVCPACNLKKGNFVYNVQTLRFYHEMAKKHVCNLLQLIQKMQGEKEYFYEPIDTSIWEVLNYDYQRGLNYAIMGYRLTSEDVVACPEFPQVDQIEKQMNIVDYVTIQGETGCGKSITMFQVGYRFLRKGWKIYLLKNVSELFEVQLPDNSENALYLIDDAQIYSDSFIDSICRQSRPNRKILIAKTVSESMSADVVILTNRDAVNLLYKDFLKRKDEIWPIVKSCDSRIGVDVFDISIETRLKSARKANTPWQFTYSLRGAWQTIRSVYLSIQGHNNCDLLAATIAVFQILFLDQNVRLDYINYLFVQNNMGYKWTNEELEYLINKKIVLSMDDIRIVHLESAYIIASLFFDSGKTDKQEFLLTIIENEFKNRRISPLGIVWLCNGYNRGTNKFYKAEDILITGNIVKEFEERLHEVSTSEEVRDMMYLLEKILFKYRDSDRGTQLFSKERECIYNYINNVDSVSAWGFGRMLNTLYNCNKNLYLDFSGKIDWSKLMNRMLEEDIPDFYAWGSLFNRGMSLLGKKKYLIYSDDMYRVMEREVSKATINTIEPITWFITSVTFLNRDRVHDLLPALQPVYKSYFEINMKKAIHIFDSDFFEWLCGISYFIKGKPSEGQRNTSIMMIEAIPTEGFAKVVSSSSLNDWRTLRDILCLIEKYNRDKYCEIVRMIDYQKLSACVEYNWQSRYTNALILEALMLDIKTARKFIRMNLKHIECFYSIMITIDATTAIKEYNERSVPLELFTEGWWEYSLSALKALKKIDVGFTKKYLQSIIKQIAEKYSDTRALEYTDNDALEFLITIKRIDEDIFNEIASQIDKEKILNNWNKCGGILPQQRRWVNKRKRELLDLIG